MKSAKSKRQFTLLTLVVALGVAVYLNWEYAKTDAPFALQDPGAVSANAAVETVTDGTTSGVLDALPVQEHRHTYTLDINSSKTFLRMFAMLGCIFLQGAFIYRISENNRLLAANDLKYRYVKMRGEIKEKELMELETIFRDEQHTAIRDTVRNQVERYEEAVRRRAEQLERAASKERKAKKLLDDAAQLRGK